MDRVSRSAVRLLVMLVTLGAPIARAQTGYQITSRIAVPGEGSLAALTADESTGLLYLSRGSAVEVIDTATGQAVGRITETPGVRDVAIDSWLHRGFTSNHEDSSVTIFDSGTLETVQRVETGNRPTSILLDPMTNRAFAIGEEIVAIDARTGKVLRTIALKSVPGAAGRNRLGHLFVTLPEKGSVAVVETNNLEVRQEFKVPKCTSPHAVAVDAANSRLFVGCANSRLVVLDAESGKRITSLSICKNLTAMVFDPGEDLLINSCNEGALSFVQENSPYKFSPSGTVKMPGPVLAMDFDQKSKKIFVATRDVDSAKASDQESKEHPAGQGSLAILVVSR